MFGLGIGELLLILAVLLLLFGASKLPQLGAGLGQGIRSFKRAFQDTQEPAKPEDEPPQQPRPPPPPSRPPQP